MEERREKREGRREKTEERREERGERREKREDRREKREKAVKRLLRASFPNPQKRRKASRLAASD